MSGKDESVTSREALLSTKPGKRIIRQALFKSKGYKMFGQYRREYEAQFPEFQVRFTRELLSQIKDDTEPASTQEEFSELTGIGLEPAQIKPVMERISNPDDLGLRVSRILNSNFVKMTFPVLSALYDAAEGQAGKNEPELKREMVEGHIIAIDLSEPMDRIVDADEDIQYLDDYKLMCPYILRLARKKVSKGGEAVLKSFEAGFADAMAGQALDVRMKSDPASITEEQMSKSYKKYRAVMGTAGRNMALASRPLGEIFSLGMAKAAEGVGCGNEMEDSLKLRALKVPSWPLYYSMLAGDARRGIGLALERGQMYMEEARLAASALPDGFSHAEFLDFLFLSIEHYNRFWHDRLVHAGIWDELASSLPEAHIP